MYDFIEKNQLIYEQQFGFRNKHSTNYALISTTESNFVGGTSRKHMIFYMKNVYNIDSGAIVNSPSSLFLSNHQQLL